MSHIPCLLKLVFVIQGKALPCDLFSKQFLQFFSLLINHAEVGYKLIELFFFIIIISYKSRLINQYHALWISIITSYKTSSFSSNLTSAFFYSTKPQSPETISCLLPGCAWLAVMQSDTPTTGLQKILSRVEANLLQRETFLLFLDALFVCFDASKEW